MKCEGYGRILAECANTWSDDEYKACNKGEDLCNDLVAQVNLSVVQQCSSDQTISTFGSLVDPLTYESPTSMTTL